MFAYSLIRGGGFVRICFDVESFAGDDNYTRHHKIHCWGSLNLTRVDILPTSHVMMMMLPNTLVGDFMGSNGLATNL